MNERGADEGLQATGFIASPVYIVLFAPQM